MATISDTECKSKAINSSAWVVADRKRYHRSNKPRDIWRQVKSVPIAAVDHQFLQLPQLANMLKTTYNAESSRTRKRVKQKWRPGVVSFHSNLIAQCCLSAFPKQTQNRFLWPHENWILHT